MNRLLLIFVIYLTVISCENNNSNSDLRKKRLKEYTKVEGGIMYRFVFFYDSFNRLIEEDVHKTDQYENARLTIKNYYYKQNLLDSISFSVNDSLTGYSSYKYYGDTIEEHYFDLILDIINKTIYIKNNNYVSKVINSHYKGDMISYHSYSIQHWQNNNLVSREVFEISTDNNYYNSMNQYFEYDTLINPFKQLEEQLFFGSARSSFNNITHLIDVTDYDDTIFFDTYYTYDEFKLPLSSNVKVKYVDTTLTIEYTYKYEDFN